MKTYTLALVATLGILVSGGTLRAIPPIEADPNKEYPINPQVGPFVICVKGYMGPNARSLANTLALHLRKQGWPAFVYDHTAEEKKQIEQTLQERYRAAPELAKKRTIRVQENWGVFVGGYRDIESAGKDIEKLKKATWDALPKTALDHVPDTGTRQLLAVSPFAHAFATRNPTVAVAKNDPNAPDPIWKDLNDGRPYNLLKCGKPWTLAVKQFTGVNAIQPRSSSDKFLNALGLGDRAGDSLDASAKQAEEVAKLLRKNNIDAFVLHTRGASIVTVGAFDRQDDPKMQQLQQKMRGFKLNGIADPRAAEMFQFFQQPLPMPVPKL